LVGPRPFALAGDDAAGAVPEEAGVKAAPGSAELRVSPLPDAGVLESADEIVGTGPGFAGCIEEHPASTARTALAAHRIRRTVRCRGRWVRMLPFIIMSVGRALAALCHRDTPAAMASMWTCR